MEVSHDEVCRKIGNGKFVSLIDSSGEDETSSSGKSFNRDISSEQSPDGFILTKTRVASFTSTELSISPSADLSATQQRIGIACL